VKVIDASALVKYVNRESGYEAIVNHILHGCITVELALKELGNALWKRVIRGEVGLEDARQVLKLFTEGRIVRFAAQEDLVLDAFNLSTSLNITVYDAFYIALAERLKVELVTADRKQAEKARELGVKTTLV